MKWGLQNSSFNSPLKGFKVTFGDHISKLGCIKKIDNEISSSNSNLDNLIHEQLHARNCKRRNKLQLSQYLT